MGRLRTTLRPMSETGRASHRKSCSRMTASRMIRSTTAGCDLLLRCENIRQATASGRCESAKARRERERARKLTDSRCAGPRPAR